MNLLFFLMTVLLLFILFFFKRAYENTKKPRMNHIHFNQEDHHGPLAVLHLSDLHLENLSVKPCDLLSELQGEKIDLIALTGDFLDRKRSLPKLIPYLKAFQQLHPTYGTFAVFGNHDYVLHNKAFLTLKAMMKQYDCTPLQNEHATIELSGLRLNIIGIDDFSTKRSNPKKAYENLKPGYNLVLTHDPNVVLHMKPFHFDYLLAGHFHNGQIHWPKPFHLIKMGKLVRMNMIQGLHHIHGKPFYISEGLGQTGINIRVGSRPEITLHHLYALS